ncbi:Homeodomain-like [Acididesulfobacillus acetoxydans]|uniref:Homeodomain-like n=1 Tax=Acididesulfobacillus acetoxydans TaxID=1561005 RepID=A0A8S0X552_9FIRM|nr:Homeodomain-like [Acididesulfobacillus acetoxydans]CEJ07186.1 Homeodomain-like [Acididesulfobacillus acetoxydans]
MYRLNHERQKIQEFRKTIVLKLRDLEPAERSRLIDELTEKTFSIPFSRKRTLSRSLLYQWLKEYRENPDQGKALWPKERKDRDTFRNLGEEQKAALRTWRQENTYRSVSQLREELMAHPETSTPSIPSESTIARYLRSLSLDRHTLRQQASSPATTTAPKSGFPMSLPIRNGSGWRIPKDLISTSSIRLSRRRRGWPSRSYLSTTLPALWLRPGMSLRTMKRGSCTSLGEPWPTMAFPIVCMSTEVLRIWANP